MRPLILASQSPRRRELMTVAGYIFTTTTADIDETPLPNEDPSDYTLRVSHLKAEAVRPTITNGALIISSDTTVALGNDLLGKPESTEDATLTLRRLRGQLHQVYTAITIWDTQTDEIYQDLAVTDLRMRDYSDTEIAAYIATGDPFDKAGSYAIQHKEFQPVTALIGCYANVVGLPLCHLTRTLRKLGIEPNLDVPQACIKANDINCTVFEPILAQQE